MSEVDSVKAHKEDVIKEIQISKTRVNQQFFHFFDLSSLIIKPGDEIEYYFEVWDNDGVNGSKAAQSHKMVFRIPTLDEIEDKTEDANEKIKDDIKESIEAAKRLQKDIDKLNKELLNKKSISWQEKKKIQNLLDRQKEIEEKVNKLNRQNKEKTLKEQQYKNINEDIFEKLKKLEELFEKIMTDEIKKLFKELEKLLENVDKNKIRDKLEEMKLNAEDIEKQLDRNLELFKQLELEKKISDTKEKIDELKEKQKKLSEESKKGKTEKEKLTGKQEKLNKEFEKIKEDLEDIKKKNKELEDPNKLKDTKQEQENIDKEMKDSKNLLNQGRMKKASQSQKNASDEMQKLSDKLQDMQDEMAEEEMGEDIAALREILENLVQLSFDQEELMENLKKTSKNNPRYSNIIKEQQKIKEGLRMVEDSLFALSKRQMSIKPYVNKEINKINLNVEKALELLLDYQGKTGYDNTKSKAVSRQQFVMTSVNNLALLLSEALKDMQNQSNMQKSGKKKKCSKPKPGQGMGKMKSMQQLQQQLNKEIEQLKKDREKGKQKGLGHSKKSISEKLARMAAQQEAIRKMVQEFADDLKSEGNRDDGTLKKIMEDMEKTETDLVNKMISNQTLRRQKEILTRLLQSEKADRKRELDKKRKSNEAKSVYYGNPKQFLEYKRLKQKEQELLKTVPPELKPFYKQKVNEYFYKFE